MPDRRSSFNLPTASHRLRTLLIAIVSDEPSCKPKPHFVPVMPSTSRGTLGKEVSPSTSIERFVPFMLSKKAMRHSTWALGGALSNSDRAHGALAQRRGIARHCGGLEFFGTNASVKLTGDHHCGRYR